MFIIYTIIYNDTNKGRVMSISRWKFLQICNNAIHKSRKNVCIDNQLSGYIAFHNETKTNDFINEQSRKRYYEFTDWNNNYGLAYSHDLVEYTGLGRCIELADYLAYEILKKLKSHEIEDATVKMVNDNSEEIDHTYIHLEIILEGEIKTLWELDAWDPRIIDITPSPKTNKNRNIEDLTYGTCVKYGVSLKPNEINFNLRHHFIFNKPVKGEPERESTPEPKMIEKHNDWLFDDYSIERAVQKGKIFSKKRKFDHLDAIDSIGPLQKRRCWQKSK